MYEENGRTKQNSIVKTQTKAKQMTNSTTEKSRLYIEIITRWGKGLALRNLARIHAFKKPWKMIGKPIAETKYVVYAYKPNTWIQK